jgi:hypothetical protein
LKRLSSLPPVDYLQDGQQTNCNFKIASYIENE